MRHCNGYGSVVYFLRGLLTNARPELIAKATRGGRGGAGEQDMDVRFSPLLSLIAVLAAGCSTAHAPIARGPGQGPGCVLEPELLQRCDPPALPTVQTFEQIDMAVTEAYVCTNKLNAQLAEILRRCGAEGRDLRQALLLSGTTAHADLDR